MKSPKNTRQLPKVNSLMKRHFLGGLLVVIPFGAAVWILATGVEIVWGLQELLPDQWKPENFLRDESLILIFRGLFVISMTLTFALAVSILGWMSKQFLGKKVLRFVSDGFILRIPIVRSIYGALDQLLRAMAAGEGQQFNRVVYVPFPHKDCWAIGFVTGAASGPNLPDGYLNVFVPATPNPTSGFHLIVKEADVRDANMRVEEAFRTILSLGIAQPNASTDKET
jgi:uncharacterized membrane protein